MSSDTAKENASVVDSSVTEWKNDMGNSDDPDTPSYKRNEDSHNFRAEKSGRYVVENSPMSKRGKLYNTRYFVIKSLNHQNIQLSSEKGIWATQVMNEPILEEAFHNSGRVILIFSVNMSGFFQGYAQMMSSVGWRRDHIWSQGSGKNNPWGRSFKVKWLRLNDLPFQKTLHLKNPLNDYKPVKISRDCQELPEDIGEALCELIDGENDHEVGILKSVNLPPKKPCIEPACTLGEEYNAPSQHTPWAWNPMPYSSFLYAQHAEASRFCLAHQGSTPTAQIDIWGLPAESPLASNLTDEDFLEMTYEEYLEVHSRNIKQSNLPAGGHSRIKQNPARSKNCDDDSNSSEQCRPRKRPHHSSEK